MYTTTIKPFAELTTVELYNILQLRSAVFVVEQDCVYQDIDHKDQKAIHVLGYVEEELIAYTRIFNAGDYFKEASIGRVAVKQTHRNFGYGNLIMQSSIQAIKTHFNHTKIHISAQEYLLQFYTSLGFTRVGEGYLEDNIPHIAMVKES